MTNIQIIAKAMWDQHKSPKEIMDTFADIGVPKEAAKKCVRMLSSLDTEFYKWCQYKNYKPR